MSSRLNLNPFNKPERGMPLSIGELRRVFDKVEHSGLGGPDVQQEPFGNVYPDAPVNRKTVIIGEKHSTEEKWGWYDSIIDEEDVLVEINQDNPDGHITDNSTYKPYNYVMDPLGFGVAEGDKCIIEYNEYKGYWIVVSKASTSTSDYTYKYYELASNKTSSTAKTWIEITGTNIWQNITDTTQHNYIVFPSTGYWKVELNIYGFGYASSTGTDMYNVSLYARMRGISGIAEFKADLTSGASAPELGSIAGLIGYENYNGVTIPALNSITCAGDLYLSGIMYVESIASQGLVIEAAVDYELPLITSSTFSGSFTISPWMNASSLIDVRTGSNTRVQLTKLNI